MSVSRRELLRAAGAAAAASAVSRFDVALGAEPKMPTRPLGKTGWRASIYALGSAEMPDEASAIRAVNALIDGGVNYLDTAPSYMGTRSEQTLGKVLKTRRGEVYLATKTLRRDAAGAYAEIKESLERLQTKQIDRSEITFAVRFIVLRQLCRQNHIPRQAGVLGHVRKQRDVPIRERRDNEPFL